MKFHSSLTYILGSALFISHIALDIQLEATSYEQCTTAYTTEKEILAYLEQAEDNIRNAIERILSISPEKQTIENTLHPLQKLLTETSSTLMTLKHLGQTESPLQPITSQSFLYLLNLSIKTFQIPELRHALVNNQLIDSTPYSIPRSEDQVLACFLEKSQDSYIPNSVSNLEFGPRQSPGDRRS